MTKEPADEQIQRDTDFLRNEWKSILQSNILGQSGMGDQVRIEGVAKPTIRFDGWLVEDADD